jgi:hypothetical protein
MADAGDSGASAWLTNWLKRIRNDSLDEVPENVTATSLRIGATNTMANNPTCDLTHIILRGGWEFSSIVKVFTYLLQIVANVIVGGRALSGWADARAPCFPPRLAPIVTPSNEIRLRNFLAMLFHLTSDDYAVKGRLRPLVETCFASVLMYHDEFSKRYVSVAGQSGTHKIVESINATAKVFGFTRDDLTAFGDAIRRDWKERNACAFADTSAAFDKVVSLVNHLKTEINHMKELHSELADKIVREVAEVKALECANASKLDDVMKLLREVLHLHSSSTNQAYQGSSPPSHRKRPRILQQDAAHEISPPTVTDAAGGKTTTGDEGSMELLVAEDSTSVQKHSRAPNAFSVLMTSDSKSNLLPSQRIEKSIKGVTLLQLLEADMVGGIGLFTGQDKSRVNCVRDYAIALFTPEEAEYKKTLVLPPADDPSYVAWSNTLKETCKTINDRVLARIAEEEVTYMSIEKTARTESKISGLESRIKDIIKAKKEQINTANAAKLKEGAAKMATSFFPRQPGPKQTEFMFPEDGGVSDDSF